MPSPNAARPAPSVSGKRASESDQLGGAIDSSNRTSLRLPRLNCAYCGKKFAETSKRPTRLCSPRCRKAFLRERARLSPSQVSQVGLSRCAFKSSTGGKRLQTQNRPPTPQHSRRRSASLAWRAQGGSQVVEVYPPPRNRGGTTKDLELRCFVHRRRRRPPNSAQLKLKGTQHDC